jgi:acetoacetyl-CoA reductase
MARVAIVTGGTRGIGEAISIALKKLGMEVAANYAGNDERAREFSDRTGIRAFKWDVADFDACQQGVAQVKPSSGRSMCWSTTPGSPATRPSSGWTTRSGRT